MKNPIVAFAVVLTVAIFGILTVGCNVQEVPEESHDTLQNTENIENTKNIEEIKSKDMAALRGTYFDFGIRYSLDYVPFFEAGEAPTDSPEYLFYAFAINLDNWGDDKGVMTRDYVDKVIHDHFEVGDITHTAMSKGWDYDGEKYTAIPQGIKDKPIFVLNSWDSFNENGRTIYRITMDYCISEDYPVSDEQMQSIRAAIVAGDFGALTVNQTESFSFYINETTKEPVFLSHTLIV
ncbi:MAG: hypothetical protein AAGU27_28770 [Dehalobacterium sp.]